ncbi:unnamed protein product [Periconia digitata]|uniref:Uncharacterized protein n=1 Tax=Periconia digitata TaxID=1303443 RepID=A0A9W4XXX1_9PLEO|nr:unnamed protein product [Periconia digitata]
MSDAIQCSRLCQLCLARSALRCIIRRTSDGIGLCWIKRCQHSKSQLNTRVRRELACAPEDHGIIPAYVHPELLRYVWVPDSLSHSMSNHQPDGDRSRFASVAGKGRILPSLWNTPLKQGLHVHVHTGYTSVAEDT